MKILVNVGLGAELSNVVRVMAKIPPIDFPLERTVLLLASAFSHRPTDEINVSLVEDNEDCSIFIISGNKVHRNVIHLFNELPGFFAQKLVCPEDSVSKIQVTVDSEGPVRGNMKFLSKIREMFDEDQEIEIEVVRKYPSGDINHWFSEF